MRRPEPVEVVGLADAGLDDRRVVGGSAHPAVPSNAASSSASTGTSGSSSTPRAAGHPGDLQPDRLGHQLDELLPVRLLLGAAQPAARRGEHRADQAEDQRVERGHVVLGEPDVQHLDADVDEVLDLAGDLLDRRLHLADARAGRVLLGELVQRGVLARPPDVGRHDPPDDVDRRALEGQRRHQLGAQQLERPALDGGVEVGAVGEVAVDDGAAQPGAVGDLLDVHLDARLGVDEHTDGGVQDVLAACLVVAVPAQLSPVGLAHHGVRVAVGLGLSASPAGGDHLQGCPGRVHDLAGAQRGCLSAQRLQLVGADHRGDRDEAAWAVSGGSPSTTARTTVASSSSSLRSRT